jgi:threonine dehydrogenase-like Zn-dependent dehydrogenase
MKAVVFHGIGDVRLDDVKEPEIKDELDAIVRLTASAICGTDLHFVRGTMAGMKPGTILGHEGVGVVEEIGKGVRNLKKGDRVVIPSTIGCGSCSYCRAGYFSQCDHANPNGPKAGTAFYGGPADSGPFDGMQAEFVRVPYANVGCVKLPEEVDDDRAILLSDIFPTAYMGAELAEITPGDTVAVFGCGPVGQFAIASAKLLGAGRVFAIDAIETRLEMARAQGAEVVDFGKEDPITTIMELTRGIGVDRAIDAVGVDAWQPSKGPAARSLKEQKKELEEETQKIAPDANPKGDLWVPGNAPSLVLQWGVKVLAKAGSFGIIGVYSMESKSFPIGEAMNKNLTIKAGNCNHRKYIPKMVEWVRSGRIDPATILTQREPMTDVISAYQEFDRRRPGWVKVELLPQRDSKAA